MVVTVGAPTTRRSQNNFLRRQRRLNCLTRTTTSLGRSPSFGKARKPVSGDDPGSMGLVPFFIKDLTYTKGLFREPRFREDGRDAFVQSRHARKSFDSGFL